MFNTARWLFLNFFYLFRYTLDPYRHFFFDIFMPLFWHTTDKSVTFFIVREVALRKISYLILSFIFYFTLPYRKQIFRMTPRGKHIHINMKYYNSFMLAQSVKEDMKMFCRGADSSAS